MYIVAAGKEAVGKFGSLYVYLATINIVILYSLPRLCGPEEQALRIFSGKAEVEGLGMGKFLEC